VESTEPKKVYGVKLDFVSERTIKDHHHQDDFSPVPHASCFRMILALATQNNMYCDYVDKLRRPLYGMPIAARAWHHTMSAYLRSQGCKLVGFERSMWTVVKEGHVILFTAHIDDFIIAWADRKVLDEFRTALLQRFEGTYEGEVHTYLGYEILRAKHFYRRNIMRKTYCAPMTIGIVFRLLPQ
jgi:hypothetical protein